MNNKKIVGAVTAILNEQPHAAARPIVTYRLATRLALLLIVVFSFVIRAYGINFGLPYRYDPDEQVFVEDALRMVQEHDPNPRWFGHPGTTNIYSIIVASTVVYGLGVLHGNWKSIDAYRTHYYADPSPIYLASRLTMALFASLGVWLIFLIGRRMFNSVIGLGAAILTALTPLFVDISRLIRPDTQVTFFVLIAFWFCLDILKKKNWRSYILAGIFTGIAVVTKYPAALVVLVIIAAHALSTNWHWRDHLKLVLGGGIATLGTAFLVSPFLFLNFNLTLHDLTLEARTTNLSATGEGLLPNVGWYLSTVLSPTFTIIGMLLIAVGIVWCLLSRDRAKWLLVLFPVAFLLFMSALSLRWDRWIVPTLPFLSLLLAAAIYELARWIGQRVDPRLGLIVGAALLTAIIVPILSQDLIYAHTLSDTDTRTIARQWIMDHIPAGSKLLVEVYTPQLPAKNYLYYTENNGQLFGEKAKGSNHTDFMPGGHIGRLADLRQLSHTGIDYIVMSNIYGRYLAESSTYPNEIATYQKVLHDSMLLLDVEPKAGETPGPGISIYRYEPVF